MHFYTKHDNNSNHNSSMSIHGKHNNGAWSIIGEVMMGNTRKNTIHNIYYNWYKFISKVDCIQMQFIIFSYCRIIWYPYIYVSTRLDYLLHLIILRLFSCVYHATFLWYFKIFDWNDTLIKKLCVDFAFK